MKRTDIKNIYSLSPTQEGILFHSQLSEDSSVYFEQVRLDLEGAIDRDVFERSLGRLVDRHDVLRTVFTFKKTQKPRQVVLKKRRITLHYQDLGESEKKNEEVISSYLNRNSREGFDLSKDLLMRVALFKTGYSSFSAIWSFHHIIMDGWCFGILIKDFVDIYHHLSSGRSYSVPPPPLYRDFIWWIERQNHSEALEFWREYLDDYESGASLPKKDTLLEADSYCQRQITLELDHSLNAKIIALCKQANVTLHSFFSGLWGLVLHCFNDCGDAVFGNVVAGRPAELANCQDIVGLFINTIPLRVTVKSGESFLRLLEILSRRALDWKRYEFVSLADIQKETTLKRNVFDHIFGVENFPLSQTIQQASKRLDIGFSITGIKVLEQTSYHLNIMVNAGPTTQVYFIYNEIVYESTVIQSAVSLFHWLARQLTAYSNRPLRQIQWVTPEEKERILSEFNDTHEELPASWGVLERIFHYMAETPDHAVSYDSRKSKSKTSPFTRTMTYGFWRKCIDNVASQLRELGFLPGDVAGLMIERGFECLVGMMAILSVGGVYLPLDPNIPEKRTNFMIKDSGVRVLLNRQTMETSFAERRQPLDMQTAFGGSSAGNPAYVIYTSGSTGTPKGVMISHGSLGNYLYGAHLAFDKAFSHLDRGLCQSSICFDVSTVEMFLPLCFGGSLVLVPGGWNYEPALVGEAIVKTAITFTMIPPSLLNDVCDFLLQAEKVASLDKLLSGLELIEDSTLERYFGVNREIKIINGYGPTETTICATLFRYKSGSSQQKNIPIGIPMANVRVVIVDSQQRLVPVGVPGEIYIGGFGVGIGYLNRPDLTEERFVKCPDEANQGRWYRTGDLGCFLEDGNIRFLGRNDRQVKIRGYRVELGEIERHLSLFHQVKSGVAMVKYRAASAPFLCAYLVPEEAVDVDVNALRSFLQLRLPEYMIPAHFIHIQEIPLTANGKIDRKRLPDPSAGEVRRKIRPKDPTGETLAAIWSELLNIPQDTIGIDDHFFYLGGHSLTIARMVARIHQELGVALPLRKVMRQPFIRAISDLLHAADNQSIPSIISIEKKDYYPLSQSQRGQFVLFQQQSSSTNYNISRALEVKGRLDRKKIQTAFVALIQRHESLRTSFRIVSGQPVQRIHSHIDFLLHGLDCRLDGGCETISSIIESFIAPFDLETAPLLRVGAASLSAERHLLLVDMHHIIADGLSAAILVRECIDLYRGKTLPELDIQYKDYSAWEEELQRSTAFAKQLEYWQNQFKPLPPPLELPMDFSPTSRQKSRGDMVETELGGIESRTLLRWCRDNDCTLFTAISAMVGILLARLSGQDDVVIGIPESGRHHPSLDSIIGMFVNTLPLRFRIEDFHSFRDFLKQAKNITAGALQNRDVSFADLIRHLGLQGKPRGNPLFDVMLTFENIAMPSLSLPDLDISVIDSGDNDVKFDLMVAVLQQEERITIHFHYATTMFKRQTMNRWIGYLRRIISRFTTNSELPPAKIELFGAEEKQEILSHLTGPTSQLPYEATIVDLFYSQVRENAGRTALIHHEYGDHMTYGLMNEEVKRRVASLQKRGVRRGSIVGIFANRSLDTIMGIFAVLCAGAAYLPLDSSWPDQRLDFIIRDSQPELVLYRAIETQLLQHHHSDNVYLENVDLEPHDMAYIMYTSGSTGTPKGTVVEHRSVVRVVSDSNYIKFYSSDRVLQLSTTAFDGSVFDIYGAFLNGGALVLVGRETILSPQALGNCILKEAATVFFMTAALFNVMVEEALDSLHWIRVIVFGGEQASPHHVRKAFDYLEGWLINGYGPTESTVFAVCHQVDMMEGRARTIPIGKPITNTFLRIVDHHMRQVPIGVIGELFIGGSGLGRGYMNRPTMTAERFVRIQDSMTGESHRFYRSGDLARLRDDGNIEFLGRLDDQLKIRGFRIEPGEIENCLCSHPLVQEAVVVPLTQGEANTILAAYIVAGADDIPEPKRLLAFLRHRLPAYMIPTFIVPIEKIPLNINGKVDRQALPIPQKESNRSFIQPKTDRQKTLAAIWIEILSIDKIGLDDDFFEKGGHSLWAAVLVKRISEEFGVAIPLVGFLECPTIRRLDSMLQINTSQQAYSQSVMLRAGDPDKPAIFFLHAGSGEVDGYVELCKNMTSPAACWGIRMDKNEFLYPKNIEIRDLASEYIKIVRGIQPSGPYRLFGWCIGGTIAFEMAVQLHETGQEVELLFMVNSAAPGTFPLDRGRAFTLESELQLLRNFGISFTSVSSIPELWDAFRWRNIDRAILSSCIPNSWRMAMPEWGSVSKESYLQSILVARSLDRARAAYIPSGKLKRTIHYFSASESRLDDIHHWQSFCSEPLRCSEVSGNHFTIFSQPHVKILSQALDDSL